MIKSTFFLAILISLSSSLIADEAETTHQWHVADGDYQICDSEKIYRHLLHYSLYGVGKKPVSGCQLAPAGALVKINHCVESDIIICNFTFTPISGSLLNGWASEALLREISP